MEPYLWGALGAALGWGASLIAADRTSSSKAETVGVGVFGALIGGQMQLTLAVPVATGGFQAVTLLGALAGTVAMLAVLALFRKSITPPKVTRKKQRAR